MDDWTKLIEDIAACKARGTCRRLGVRKQFFEPNPHTLDQWRHLGLYREGIDRRVVFVCVSPGDLIERQRSRFRVSGVNGCRGWAGYDTVDATRMSRFRKIRREFGLDHCLVTNAVKCGPHMPKKDEIENCSIFILRELQTVRPTVIACVGQEAHKIYDGHVAPKLGFEAAAVRVTSYALRRGEDELFRCWRSSDEFPAVAAALASRGELAPDYLSMSILT